MAWRQSRDRARQQRRLGWFVADRRGQDLVEYALLVGAIGLVTIAAGPAIIGALSAAYGAWNTSIHNQWVPPDPGAGS